MRWTEEQLAEYNLRRAKAGDKRVCAAEPECAPGLSLDSAGKREVQGRPRAKILFTVYARRPLDWDNYRLKDMQDHLIKSGILQGDEWDILEGSVISCKAHSEAEEKTVIEITLTENPVLD